MKESDSTNIAGILCLFLDEVVLCQNALICFQTRDKRWLNTSQFDYIQFISLDFWY